MPTETFFKLPEEKKKKIMKAAKEEFTRVPFNEASIKNIVDKAKIARGSFYQYFESKEDILSYLMENHVEVLDKKTKDVFEKTNGDIFAVFLQIYDNVIEECSSQGDFEFYKQIFENVKTCDDNIFFTKIKEIKPRNFSEYYELIDTKKMKIQNKQDVDILVDMLFTITRRSIIKTFRNSSKQEEREKYLKQIEYLKYGVMKK